MTTRRWMVFVLTIALGLGLALPAARVRATKEYHVHSSVIFEQGQIYSCAEAAIESPFWPRYWRCLLGLPWQNQALCGRRDGHFEELCSQAHPEMMKPDSSGGFRVEFTEAQREMVNQLKARLASKSP